MGVAQMEEVVSTVRAILKTLECPICLDLLKTPVSAGCGHFFCRECVSGILQSTYRAPCPLCKRSFTRRSIQEASQRQSIILAARALANTCTNLTEVQFYGNESSFKTPIKASEDASAPLKKPKTSKPENQDASSRKRKSCENEEEIKNSDCQNGSVKEISKDDGMNDNLANDDYSSPNKRICPDSEENDSEDLPKLEDIFSEMAKHKRNTDISKKNEKVAEKPLSIFPTDKASTMKTYSSIHRKGQKSNLSRVNSDDGSKCKSTSLSDKNNDSVTEEKKNNEPKSNSPVKNINKTVQARNKINALKNKTNEVPSDANVIQNDSTVKAKNGNKIIKSDIANKLKENALRRSPKMKKIEKLRRKSQTKLTTSDTNVPSKCSSDDSSLKENTVLNDKIPNEKNSNTKDCYTLNQVNLLHSENVKQSEDCSKKIADDPSKLAELTDTAVCVDSVTSPLGARNISLDKSPGWSRVRKVKKDFKMKKFTSLHVEKNSSNISSKNAVSPGQETLSTIDKSDNSVDVSIDNKNEDNPVITANEDAIDIAAKDLAKVPEKEVIEISENAVLGNSENFTVSKGMDNGECENNAGKYNEDFEKMDYTEDVENEIISVDPECNAENKANMNNPSEMRVLPSVSITSNSLICTKFADANDKIASHNVMKSQKIVCELKPTPLSKKGFVNQSDNFILNHIQDNDFNQKESNKWLSNSSDLKPTSFALATPLTSYQNFNTQSVQNDHNFHYVEQSQQTSQIFNMDYQNPLRVAIPHQPPLIICPNSDKTKVVKRACLTFEEIQDSFYKSSQSGLPEKVYSAPFFSGLFKLDIRVSDETLNVSVLKVIDPISEVNNPSSAASMLSDKSIQASSSLFPPNEIVPSSNAGSESSQPDSAVDPFPYLNKEVATNLTANPVDITSNFSDENMPPTQPNLINKNVLDESVLMIAESSVEKNVLVEISEPVKDDNDGNCMDEDHFNMSEIIHFPSNSTDKDNPDQNSSSPKSPDSKDENSKQLPQKTDFAVNKCDVLSNKINTEEAAECPRESDNKNEECTQESENKNQECTQESKNENKKCSRESEDKNQSSSNANVLFADPFAKCKEISFDNDNLFNKTNNSSKSEQISFDKSSSSDEDESLKKLQQCIRKEKAPPEKKQSRLSLKKKSSFKRIQVQESSDESDSETSLSHKDTSKKTKKDVFAKPEIPLKPKPIEENFSSLRELNVGDRKNLFNSAPAELPSTLNSVLSEDTNEANASDIILEIEDLSDKIKYLEEKLKLCGHGENKSSRDESDSEDSTDLFPQSVPPTPPNKM